jgi:UDP:flavonoid glycosyltransferase YjiC (YdhE family)
MVVLPLFWDQHDNAQRIDELGLGKRLATYEWEAEELRGAIDGLLADGALRKRLTEVSTRIQAADGRTRAADLIERLART